MTAEVLKGSASCPALHCISEWEGRQVDAHAKLVSVRVYLSKRTLTLGSEPCTIVGEYPACLLTGRLVGLTRRLMFSR